MFTENIIKCINFSACIEFFTWYNCLYTIINWSYALHINWFYAVTNFRNIRINIDCFKSSSPLISDSLPGSLEKASINCSSLISTWFVESFCLTKCCWILFDKMLLDNNYIPNTIKIYCWTLEMLPGNILTIRAQKCCWAMKMLLINIFITITVQTNCAGASTQAMLWFNRVQNIYSMKYTLHVYFNPATFLL